MRIAVVQVGEVGELPEVEWQRCVVHLQGNVLAYVYACAGLRDEEVDEDLGAIFQGCRENMSSGSCCSIEQLYLAR